MTPETKLRGIVANVVRAAVRVGVGDVRAVLAALDEARADRDALAARVAEAERENDRLRGIVPELPERPPHGDGLPRYGLRWTGPTTPVVVPLSGGYWTPWHLAERAIDAALARLAGRSAEEERAEAARVEREDVMAHIEMKRRAITREQTNADPGAVGAQDALDALGTEIERGDHHGAAAELSALDGAHVGAARQAEARRG